MFNNNMFGNQQSMRPNFMSAMKRPNPGANPVFPGLMAQSKAAQGYLANQQQGIAQTLNRPIQRMADTAQGIQRPLPAGAVPSGVNSGMLQPRINTEESRNVLAGQPMGLDRTMRPLNIPGMHLDGNQMVKDTPVPIGGANIPNRGLGGMTPNQFRSYQQTAKESGGPAGTAAAVNDGFGANYEENTGLGILNRQAQVMKRNPEDINTGLNSSYANTRMARMARRNGFGSAASFQNFMNQYNARQNRGGMVPNVTPRGLAAINGNMASVEAESGQTPSQQLKDQPSLLRRQIPDETYEGFKGIGNGIRRGYRSYLQYQNDNGGYIPG